MSEQLPIKTHDMSIQPSIIDGIQRISKFIGMKDAERMVQEFWDGQAIVAEDDRLALDTAECTRQQQVIAEQIRRNEARRHVLAPQLAAMREREAEMKTFIEGFAKFVHSEEAGETRQARDTPSSPVIPPPPTVPPKQPVAERPFEKFRDTTVQRPLGGIALAQNMVVRGK